MSTKSLRLGEVIDQLTQQQLLPARETHPLPADLSGRNDAESSPWYVKALIGIAAWIAALFIGFFLGAAGLVDSAEAMLIWGAVLTVLAIGLKWLTRHSIFWGQLAFAAVLAGQGLLIGGFSWQDTTPTTIALFTIGLELIIFLLYPDALHRMLSVLAIFCAVTVILYEQDLQLLIHGLILLVALGAVVVWQQEFRLIASRWSPFRAPLGYAFALALFGLCLFPLASFYGVLVWWPSTAGLAVVLLYLAACILREVNRPLFSLVGLWAVGAVALLLIPAYETPGILAAVIVLLLGYWRANTLIMGLATIFLLFFLSVYYYNLDITLINKSYILMGTGAILLVVRFFFHQVIGGRTLSDEA